MEILLHKVQWQVVITVTFGYKPDLEEVEDILYKLHYRIDRRLVKHLEGKSFLTADERSEWILFPELGGGRGLHYHGFIKLNMNPNLGTSYETEWYWMKAAFRDTLRKLNKYVTNGNPLDFRIYERSCRWNDNLKMILYSLKEFCEGTTHTELNNEFDRIAYTIISKDCWKPKPIYKHRGSNKVDRIPERPNKIGILGLF